MKYQNINLSNKVSRYFVLETLAFGRYTEVRLEVTLPDFDFVNYCQTKGHNGKITVISPTKVSFANGTSFELVEANLEGCLTSGKQVRKSDKGSYGYELLNSGQVHSESQMSFWLDHGFKLKGFNQFVTFALPDEIS